MATKPSAFDNCITLRQHLRENELPSVYHHHIEKMLLALHHAQSMTTLFEINNKTTAPVFKRNWLAQYTPAIERYGVLYKHFQEPCFLAKNCVWSSLLKSNRFTVDQWLDKVEWDAKKIKVKRRPAKQAVVKICEQIALPSYRRAILNRATGNVTELPEYPCWLLDSINFDFVR